MKIVTTEGTAELKRQLKNIGVPLAANEPRILSMLTDILEDKYNHGQPASIMFDKKFTISARPEYIELAPKFFTDFDWGK